MVNCIKLGKSLPGMPFKPLTDELGQRIYDNVSMEGWQLWIEHSKIIVNEYRLDLTMQKAHDLLREQMEQFFFGEGAELPKEFVAPE